MDEDQQVAVLLQLNLGNTGGESSLNTSWRDDFASAPQDISLNESTASNQQEHNSNDSLIQKDLEFIRQHAREMDSDVILSCLQSQMDNPRRLESVMCDLLNIPNALELIEEYRRSATKQECKKVEAKPEEATDSKDTNGYLQKVKDMFPDADVLFLISECQQLESWDDFSRFINTVMLSGVYPKKGVMECTPRTEPSKPLEIINVSNYRTAEVLSSEEEISSSGLSETPKKRRKRKNRESNSSNGSLEEVDNGKWLNPTGIDVIDLTSDNTEPYTPPNEEALQNFLQSIPMNGQEMEIEEVFPTAPKPWETTLDVDIDNLLESQFGNTKNDDLSAIPGPSRVRPMRMSLPGGSSLFSDDSVGEKSLAEIIEEKRHRRRMSLAAPSGTRQTPVKPLARDFLLEKPRLVISSPEVSTTSQLSFQGYDTDGGCEEGEETPKVSEEWLAEQIANLVRIFPNTDPSYLREEVIKMNGSSEAVNEFVVSKLEKNDMPSRAEYEKKLEMEELQNRYTKNFSIEDFLKAVPDPWAYFSQGNRNCAKYKSHSLCYLKSAFRKRYVRDIINAFNRNECNLYLAYQDLKNDGKRNRSSRRSEFECNHNRPTTIDIQFLQEVAFIENEEKIKDFLEGEKIARQIKFDEAKRTGSLLECQCCFDSEILVEDIFYCPKDHAFCRNCIIRSVEVEMGYGRFKFECLANCEEKFTLACLQNVLKPELFSKVLQAIQMEEIRAAGIADLVQCPFCNYATIMPPEEKVMTCLNPECLKESCRSCKELNHIPLRCDEVEKSEEVKMRTYIENKMTEALVRTCYKCGKKFVKEDGCNKMTCTCGAKMCYVCRKPVSNYSHFNGQGGTEYHKCPLYSTNDELHVELVKRVGEEAKAEIMQANPNTKLMHDPTVIELERTHQTPMPGMNNGAALDVAMRAIRGTLNQEEGEANGQEYNRDRRAIRRKANPYYNRYHHHRRRPEVESDDEDDQVEEQNDHNPHHFHHHHHHHHRFRHQPHFNEIEHRHLYHFRYSQHRHHHNRSPL